MSRLTNRFLASLRFRFLKKFTKPFSHEVSNEFFGAKHNSDISDHLNILFTVTLAKSPEIVLELGTRGGESTRVFKFLAENLNFKGYSVDLDPKPEWMKNSKVWEHFQYDDIVFCKELITKKCFPNGDPFKGIDILFIDTSHEYGHTLREIKNYWPLINSKGLLIFHDTNMSKVPNRRLDGTVNRGWDNQRGVIRAIEDYFEIQLEGDKHYSGKLPKKAGFFTNLPWCNGLFIVAKE